MSEVSGTADSAALMEHMRTLGIVPELQALVVAASKRTSVTSGYVPGDYVSISPGTGGDIACFVHKSRVTVALPPRQAKTIAHRYNWAVQEANAVTSYVKIPNSALGDVDQRSFALDVMIEGIRWRALQPTRAVATAVNRRAAPSADAVCPRHFTVMLGGRCDECDDPS